MFARAWRPGAILLLIALVWAGAMRWITTRFAPAPPVFTPWFASVCRLVVFILGTAIDAARRVRSPATSVPVPWWRSTLLAGLVLAAAHGALAWAAPIGWDSFSQPSTAMLPGLQVGEAYVADTRPKCGFQRKPPTVLT